MARAWKGCLGPLTKSFGPQSLPVVGRTVDSEHFFDSLRGSPDCRGIVRLWRVRERDPTTDLESGADRRWRGLGCQPQEAGGGPSRLTDRCCDARIRAVRDCWLWSAEDHVAGMMLELPPPTMVMLELGALSADKGGRRRWRASTRGPALGRSPCVRFVAVGVSGVMFTVRVPVRVLSALGAIRAVLVGREVVESSELAEQERRSERRDQRRGAESVESLSGSGHGGARHAAAHGNERQGLLPGGPGAHGGGGSRPTLVRPLPLRQNRRCARELQRYGST